MVCAGFLEPGLDALGVVWSVGKDPSPVVGELLVDGGRVCNDLLLVVDLESCDPSTGAWWTDEVDHLVDVVLSSKVVVVVVWVVLVQLDSHEDVVFVSRQQRVFEVENPVGCVSSGEVVVPVVRMGVICWKIGPSGDPLVWVMCKDPDESEAVVAVIVHPVVVVGVVVGVRVAGCVVALLAYAFLSHVHGFFK